MSEHIKYSDDWQMNDTVRTYRDFGPCILEASISAFEIVPTKL